MYTKLGSVTMGSTYAQQTHTRLKQTDYTNLIGAYCKYNFKLLGFMDQS